MVEISQAPRTLCLDTGNQLWAVDWYEALHRDVFPERRPTRDDFGARFSCAAFLPSGCGMLCAGEIKVGQEWAAGIHVYYFA